MLLLLGLLQIAPQWRLQTADTRVTIEAGVNAPIVRDLGAVGDDHTWCAVSPVRLIERVWDGGKPISTHWRFAKATRSPRSGELTLVYRNAAPALELHSIWRARRGLGPIEQRIEFVNNTGASIAVPEQDSLSINNVEAGGPAEVWWTRRGASNALTQGGVFRDQVDSNLNLDLVSNHHEDESPVPWLAVQAGYQRGLYVGWEFSSLGHVTAKEDTSGLSLRLGLMDDFKTDIFPHDKLSIPAAFVGCYKGDMDDGAYSLHKFIMENLRANPPKSFADPAITLGLYLDAGGDKATEPDVLRCEKFAADLGVDVFMADAMWFPACGDWRWDPKRFPNGSEPIGDAIHRDKMAFGLWCAWTNGGISEYPGALSVRGPQGHPDWFGRDLPPTWEPGPFYGESACMGSPEAKAWEIAKTHAMVADYDIDYLKTDVHPMINECKRTGHRHHYGTDVSYWSTMGVYEVWDKLRASYPRLVLENCSGAPHIKDFGVIQRCAYTAVTDTLSNLPDRAGIWDSTYILPPAALVAYTYEQGYGLPGDDPGSYLFRSAMMAGWDLAPTHSKDWTSKQKREAKTAIQTYRTWIRPILRDCKVHHVLPRPDGKRWDGLFYWSDRPGKGTLFIFRPDSTDASQTVKLAGLKPDRRYRVWSQDGSVSVATERGSELMDSGLTLHLPARYTSDLIFVEVAPRISP